jgi:hypothetical protein
MIKEEMLTIKNGGIIINTTAGGRTEKIANNRLLG